MISIPGNNALRKVPLVSNLDFKRAARVAGGMGWYLKRNILQIETERVAAILLSIVFLVLISEVISAWARARVMKMK